MRYLILFFSVVSTAVSAGVTQDEARTAMESFGSALGEGYMTDSHCKVMVRPLESFYQRSQLNYIKVTSTGVGSYDDTVLYAGFGLKSLWQLGCITDIEYNTKTASIRNLK